jgi:hypothetical protein
VLTKFRGVCIVFIYTITFILNTESSAASYKMSVVNCIKVDSNTIEFDVFIKNNGGFFFLTAYQCALSFNQSIINGGSLEFSYKQGTSELSNLLPLSATGILSADSIYTLTFASVFSPEKELITPAEKRVGRFRLSNSNSFTGNISSIIWRFSEEANTILIGADFSDITNKLNHINLSGAAVFPFSVTIEKGLNLISIPGYHPIDQDADTWWEFKDTYIKVYNSSYQAVTDLEPGKAYWLLHNGFRSFKTGDEWPIDGFLYSPNYPIPGRAGWNYIGIYNYDIPVSAIKTTPENLLDGFIFKFKQGVGYSPVELLIPGYGYMIYLTDDGLINLPDSGVSVLSSFKTNSVSKSDWGKIIITDNSGKSTTLFAVDGSVNLDKYILPPAAPSETFDIRYGSGKFAENLGSDFHKIEMNGLEYPVVIKVENISIRVQDESGAEVNTKLASGEELKIYKANTLLISNDGIPVNYDLKQNYPNPFNPITTIEFSIPEEVSNVQLIIYNALGEKIAQLVNSILLPGNHKFKWDGKNAASGLYIYQLNVEPPKGGYTSSKKMILLK